MEKAYNQVEEEFTAAKDDTIPKNPSYLEALTHPGLR